MKTLAVLTGPQGSGNHLWSKIFSLHEDVFGWKSLLDNYWEPHRISEPFAAYWRDPSTLHKFDWSQSEYYFTSISIPLGIKNKGTKWCPDVVQFCTNAQALGINTKVLVIGRDQNILRHQQNRIREESTVYHFLDQLPKFDKPTFLSYELLYLYKEEYLKSLDVGFPIAWYERDKIREILELDANDKYITPVGDQILDDGNKTGVPFPDNPSKGDYNKGIRGDYLPCCNDKPCRC
tara:strand:- start:266 stop:970 length:705 start_codon:yes stop_codon:yes gene_type:complete